MKNVFKSTALIFIAVSIMSCDRPADPTPEMAGAGQANAYADNLATHASDIQIKNPTTTRPPASTQFEWQLVKTVTVPYEKGLNLSSPFSIVNEDQGDISWGDDGGCYSAIKSWKVMQANLKIVDVKTVTPEHLKTLTFSKGMIAWAPNGSASWTNYMPNGTVIAFQTNTGKYRLVVVKSAFPLVLDIYHEHYYLQL